MQQLGKFKFPIVVGVVVALLLIAGAVYMTTMYLNTNKKSTTASSAKPALVAPSKVQDSLKSANDAAQNSNSQLGSTADAFNEKQVTVAQ